MSLTVHGVYQHPQRDLREIESSQFGTRIRPLSGDLVNIHFQDLIA